MPNEPTPPQVAIGCGLYYCNRKQASMQLTVGAVLYNTATQREDTNHKSRSRPSPSFSTAMTWPSVTQAFATACQSHVPDMGISHAHRSAPRKQTRTVTEKTPVVTSCSRMQGICCLNKQGCPERGEGEPLLSPRPESFGPVTLQHPHTHTHLEFALGVWEA